MSKHIFLLINYLTSLSLALMTDPVQTDLASTEPDCEMLMQFPLPLQVPLQVNGVECGKGQAFTFLLY